MRNKFLMTLMTMAFVVVAVSALVNNWILYSSMKAAKTEAGKGVVLTSEDVERKTPRYYRETTKIPHLKPDDTEGTVIRPPDKPLIRQKEPTISPEYEDGVVIRPSPEPFLKRREPTIAPDDVDGIVVK